MVLIIDMNTEEEFMEIIKKIKGKRRCPFRKIAFQEILTKEGHDKFSGVARQIVVFRLLISGMIMIKFFSESFEAIEQLIEDLKKEKYLIINAQTYVRNSY